MAVFFIRANGEQVSSTAPAIFTTGLAREGASLLAGEDTCPYACNDYFLKVLTISVAALAPEPPVNPAPGCVPDPHR